MHSRSRLIKAMNQLLQEKNIDKITVQQLMATADVSRATFYTYFSDKYDLMNSYFREATHAHMQGMLTDPWVSILTKGSQFFKDNQRYFEEAIKSTGQNSFCEFWQQDSLQNVTNGLLARSHQDKLSPKQIQAVDFFVAGYMAVTLAWIRGGMIEAPQSLAETIYDLMPQMLKHDLW